MIQQLSGHSNDDDESPRRPAEKDRSRRIKKKKRSAVRGAEPYWMSPGVTRRLLPKPARAEVIELVTKIYGELVRNAKPALAQTTGLTVTFTQWLEILEQPQLSRQIESMELDPDFLDFDDRKNRDRDIDRYLRLVNAKLKATDLLLRLEQSKRHSRADRRARKTRDRELGTAPDRPRKLR